MLEASRSRSRTISGRACDLNTREFLLPAAAPLFLSLSMSLSSPSAPKYLYLKQNKQNDVTGECVRCR